MRGWRARHTFEVGQLRRMLVGLAGELRITCSHLPGEACGYCDDRRARCAAAEELVREMLS